MHDDPEWLYSYPHEPTLAQIAAGGCLLAIVAAVVLAVFL